MPKSQTDYRLNLSEIAEYLRTISQNGIERNRLLIQDMGFRQAQQSSNQNYNMNQAQQWEKYKWKREQQKILHAKLPWYIRWFKSDFTIVIPLHLERAMTIENFDKLNYKLPFKGSFQ